MTCIMREFSFFLVSSLEVSNTIPTEEILENAKISATLQTVAPMPGTEAGSNPDSRKNEVATKKEEEFYFGFCIAH